MGYRVRNQHGEIRCESFEALKDAFDKQLVEADDEVLEDGSSNWRKVSSYKQLTQPQRRRSLMQGSGRWYAMAVFVLLVGAGLVVGLRRGLVGFAFVLVVAIAVSGVMTFAATRAARKR
jgi:hypothetical protein